MGEAGELEFGCDEVDDGDHFCFVAVAPGAGFGGLDEGVDPFEQGRCSGGWCARRGCPPSASRPG